MRRAISLITAVSVAATSLSPLAARPALAAAAAAGSALSRADYEACQTRDDAAFHAAVEAVTQKALSERIGKVDFAQLVKDQWREGAVDRIVDAQVDAAVDEVRQETSWGNLIKSLGSKDKAQELATAVAERVYRSDAMKTAIENLAAGVGRDLGRSLELAIVEAADPAARCLEAFLGPRYGTSVAGFVTHGGAGGLMLGGGEGSADVTSSDILKQSSGGITGAAVLVLRRQMANIARRLGQRLVGSVLSRLVSVAAGGVGLVLIAKDIWDLRHGVLPIVADEMKAEGTKEKVREELAKALSEQIGEHVKEIAAGAAGQVVEVWNTFRRAHAKVLELAEANTRFKDYLNGLSPGQLPRLDAVVALILAGEGESAILGRLDNGTLNEAVTRLPPAGMEIAETSRSLETALKWHALAGENLPALVANEIHLRARPQDFSSAGLQRLLAVGDRLAISRVATVSREARDTLFDLEPEPLQKLARNLGAAELETLAGYLAGLDKAPRELLLRTVADDPKSMQLIAPERVRRAILSSRDQMAAMTMMLRPQGVLDPAAAQKDMRKAFDGRIHPLLIWERHPAVVILLAIAGLFFLLVLLRLVSPRRARPRSDGEPGAAAAVGAAPAPAGDAKTPQRETA